MATKYDTELSPPVIVNTSNLSAIQKDLLNSYLTANDICTMFDEFLVQFERMEKTGVTTVKMFLDAVEEITTAVLSILPYKLLDPKVLSHELMDFLRQMIIDLLHNWQAFEMRLNIQETDIFLKIILVFVHAAEEVSSTNSDEDRQRITHLLATKTILSLIREQILDNNLHKKGMNDDPNICALGLLTIKLLKGCPFFYSMEQNACLIETLILNCIDSYDYIASLRQLLLGESLNDIDRFLLYTCWEYVPFVALTSSQGLDNTSKNTKLINNAYDEFLIRFEHALDQSLPITAAGLSYILERCEQLLNIQKLSSLNQHAQNIIDRLVKILENLSSASPNNGDDELISISLKTFYNLSKNPEIRAIMKKRHLTFVLNKYTAIEMDENRKIAFDILAEIMDEQEIKNNPSEITSAFIYQLKQINLNEYNSNLDNTLSSLKALMQHDQIKNEFIKQGGLDKVISFIRDSDPDKLSDKQTHDALRILWSCTFNNPEALNKLQKDQKLMTRVNQLFEKSKKNENDTLKNAAEGLIWKVEKEEKFLQELAAEKEKKKQKAQETGTEEEEEEEKEKYDCMISYSWTDMDLAHRIFKQLTQNLGYKVWLDQEEMHGSTIEAMANAVESAEFILVCMSDTYKRSVNCQSEAEYAFNRKKHIIPIKMKKDFVADGWLGFIIGTRMYIDFGQHEFDKAIQLLDNEIRLQKKNRKEAKEMAKMAIKAAAASECNDDAQENVLNRQNAPNIKRMSILCDGFKGEELFDLYTMCKTNSILMYRSLKFELLHGCNRILPIYTYLRFMSCMRAVCDDGSIPSTQTMKKSHEYHLFDDE
ncbi:unnamed protein product [Rotaria sp. Silwood2]|nr:unnamed protein product [Rotaria sp. Silwood2]